jgi:hypothetical protein
MSKLDEWLTPKEKELLKSNDVQSLLKKAMEYQQAHDYSLAGQLASTEHMLLDQLVDSKEVDKAFKEFIEV